MTDSKRLDWRETWRRGFAPNLSTRALIALRDGLATDDPRLIQGDTVLPASWRGDEDFRCPTQEEEASCACAIAYCGWRGEGFLSLGEVKKYFADICVQVDHDLNADTACDWFLSWFDRTPRDEMRRELLDEVELALREREAKSV